MEISEFVEMGGKPVVGWLYVRPMTRHFDLASSYTPRNQYASDHVYSAEEIRWLPVVCRYPFIEDYAVKWRFQGWLEMNLGETSRETHDVVC